MHPSFHIDENGQLLVELVAQLTQSPSPGDPRHVSAGGVRLRAGTTVVFSSDGRVRYVATRPLPGPHLLGNAAQQELALSRVDGFHSYVAALDARDPLTLWSDHRRHARRMKERASFAAAHLGRPSRSIHA